MQQCYTVTIQQQDFWKQLTSRCLRLFTCLDVLNLWNPVNTHMHFSHITHRRKRKSHSTQRSKQPITSNPFTTSQPDRSSKTLLTCLENGLPFVTQQFVLMCMPSYACSSKRRIFHRGTHRNLNPVTRQTAAQNFVLREKRGNDDGREKKDWKAHTGKHPIHEKRVYLMGKSGPEIRKRFRFTNSRLQTSQEEGAMIQKSRRWGVRREGE